MDVQCQRIILKCTGKPQMEPHSGESPYNFRRIVCKFYAVLFLRKPYFVGYLGLLFPLVLRLYIPLFNVCNAYAYFERLHLNFKHHLYYFHYISYPNLDLKLSLLLSFILKHCILDASCSSLQAFGLCKFYLSLLLLCLSMLSFNAFIAFFTFVIVVVAFIALLIHQYCLLSFIAFFIVFCWFISSSLCLQSCLYLLVWS